MGKYCIKYAEEQKNLATYIRVRCLLVATIEYADDMVNDIREANGGVGCSHFGKKVTHVQVLFVVIDTRVRVKHLVPVPHEHSCHHYHHHYQPP